MSNIWSQLAGTAESAKRVVAKQQVCATDKERATQSVAPQPVQAVDCGLMCCEGARIRLDYLKEFRISNLYGTCFRSQRTCSIVLHLRSQPALKAFPGHRDRMGFRMCTSAGIRQF